MVECEEKDTPVKDGAVSEMYVTVMKRFSRALSKVKTLKFCLLSYKYFFFIYSEVSYHVIITFKSKLRKENCQNQHLTTTNISEPPKIQNGGPRTSEMNFLSIMIK